MANWSAFFSALGGGLSDYAGYQEDRQERTKREARQAKLDEQATAELAYQHEQDRLNRIRQDREDLQKPAEHLADQYAKQGIMVGPDFMQNQVQAGLPDAGANPGNAGGMAISALRNQGRAGNQYVASEGQAALNTAIRGKGISAPMAHGGFAVIDPSVRASLINAAATREGAAAQRGQTAAFENRRITDSENAKQAKVDEDRVEGASILSTMNPMPTGSLPARREHTPMTDAFGTAFQAARKANPTMPPEQLAKQVMEGLKVARPDLIPKAAGSGDDIDQERARRATGGRASAPAAAVAASGDSALKPITDPADVARAQTDPEFSAWLKMQGYQVP